LNLRDDSWTPPEPPAPTPTEECQEDFNEAAGSDMILSEEEFKNNLIPDYCPTCTDGQAGVAWSEYASSTAGTTGMDSATWVTVCLKFKEDGWIPDEPMPNPGPNPDDEE
jgi:hypothetical protein